MVKFKFTFLTYFLKHHWMFPEKKKSCPLCATLLIVCTCKSEYWAEEMSEQLRMFVVPAKVLG